jgi:5,6-dimethylbenzimidazole synthase
MESEIGHGLGRQTMPQTLEYSVVAAIGNLWLTARAEGVGVGWISILDPVEVAKTLDAPSTWKLIGYFCLGRPDHDHDVPELEREGWERRRPWETFVLLR